MRSTHSSQLHRPSSAPGVAGRHRTNAVRQWALARGAVADAESIDVILVVKESRSGAEGGVQRWTVIDVEEMLWLDVVEWCAAQDRPIPAHLTETLWTYLGFLHDTGQFSEGSDAIADLRLCLCSFGGLDTRGRPLTRRSRRAQGAASLRRPVRPPDAAPVASETPLAAVIPLSGYRLPSLVGDTHGAGRG